MKKTNLVAIASGKGGVGKSAISANIANILASQGYSVALFDADFGLANLDVILNVKTDKTLLNVMRNECSLDEVAIKVKHNLILIPGDSGDEILNYKDKFLSENFIKELSSLDDLDFVIIDTATGIGENVQPFLEASDEVIVITVPDPAAITDAYATIKIASKFKESIFMLMNMARNEEEAILIFENLKKVAQNNIPNPPKLALLGYIPNSQGVAKSIKERTLFTEEYPHIIPTRELKEALSRLLVKLDKNPINTANSRGFIGFLKRLGDLV